MAQQNFGCGYIFFPFVFVTFGLTALWAGNQLGPQTGADANVFRSDPSCRVDLSVAKPSGACSVIDVTVLSAVMRASTSPSKTRTSTPTVILGYPDGTQHDADLDGSDGNDFVYSVASGARGRAQTFRGTLVRVVSGRSSAETIDSPDVNARTVGEMPWVGALAIVVAIVVVGLRVRFLRRTRAPR